MTTNFQPPPTYADPVIVDEATRKGQFNPIWLKWFLDLSQFINNNGGGGAIQHNSLGGLQGGVSGEYYHLNQATYNILNNIGTPTAGAVAYGTGSTVAFSPVGTVGQVLTSNGAGSPTWTTLAKTTGSSILYGNGSGGFSNVTIGTGVSFVGGVLSATGSGGTVTSVTATTPLASSGGTTPNLTIQQSSASQSGYLSSTDWNTFNNKQPAGTYLTSVSGTSGRITSTGGTTPVIDLASGIATPGTTGSSTLIPVITIDTYGRVTSITTASNPQGTVTSVTGTSPVVSSGGATPAISLASGYGDTQNPYASKTANYVMAAPNGSAGVPTFRALVAADIPALPYGTGTVTSVSVVSANGFAGTVATSTTTPAITLSTSITGLLYGNGTALAATTISSPLTYSAGTLGITQATTSTSGYLSSTDWNTFNNKQPAGTYVTSVTGTAPVVSSGGTTPAISMAAANGTTNGYLTSTDWTTFNNKQPAGTYVTAVSVASSNGFAGTSSGGATPSLTLSTSITGLLYGNGTALAAATVSAPLTYSAGTLAITQATTSTNGYLSSTDWNTFNNKQSVSAPVTKTADFSVATTDLWLINNKSGSTCTATLPAASSYSGRVLHFQNYQAQTLISASSNVVPLVGGSAGTAILNAVAGDTCTLVSDGTNWLITQYTPNNVLLLE